MFFFQLHTHIKKALTGDPLDCDFFFVIRFATNGTFQMIALNLRMI